MAKIVQAKVMNAILGGVGPAKLGEIVEHFLHCVGGSKGFAMLMYEAYMDPKASYATKQRIMACVLDGMKHSEKLEPPIADLGLASEEDLEREAAAIILKYGEGDAKKESPQAAGTTAAAAPATGDVQATQGA